MSTTTRIPQERLATYFDAFTKRILHDRSPEAIDIELLDNELGDQVTVRGSRLVGITYDAGENVIEFELESGDHRVSRPKDVWVIEEPDGFVSALEVVGSDGVREVVSVKKVGLRRLD
jgi:hypothetical protein